MNEFDKFRKAVITSLKEGHGAITVSYTHLTLPTN